MSRQVP